MSKDLPQQPQRRRIEEFDVPNDRPVAYYRRLRQCGHPGCRICSTEQGHGPYWFASYYSNKKKTEQVFLGTQLPIGIMHPTDGVERFTTYPLNSTLQHVVRELRDGGDDISLRIVAVICTTPPEWILAQIEWLADQVADQYPLAVWRRTYSRFLQIWKEAQSQQAWLTVEEVRLILGVDKRTVVRLITDYQTLEGVERVNEQTRRKEYHIARVTLSAFLGMDPEEELLPLLSLSQVAQELEMKEKTIQTMVDRGQISVVKLPLYKSSNRVKQSVLDNLRIQREGKKK